jgi:hypothetical protein
MCSMVAPVVIAASDAEAQTPATPATETSPVVTVAPVCSLVAYDAASPVRNCRRS